MTRAPIPHNVFAASWTLLTRNWAIVVPGLVIGVVAGIVAQLVPPASVGYTPGGGVQVVGGGLVGSAIAFLAQILTIAYTTGMAQAAWERGSTTLGDGAASFREDGVRIGVAIVVYAVIGLVLALLTFGLGALVFAYLAIYAFPSVVVANNAALRALGESARIATSRFPTTLLVILGLAIAALIAVVVAGLLAAVPFFGEIAALVILQALVAYITVVITGEYIKLRSAVA